MNYSDKLRDPRWQKKRLYVMKRDDFKCRRCRSSKNELHVHHIRYFPGRDPWDYDMDDLITLCKECHNQEHNILPTYDPTEDILRCTRKKRNSKDFIETYNKVPIFEDIVRELKKRYKNE